MKSANTRINEKNTTSRDETCRNGKALATGTMLQHAACYPGLVPGRNVLKPTIYHIRIRVRIRHVRYPHIPWNHYRSHSLSVPSSRSDSSSRSLFFETLPITRYVPYAIEVSASITATTIAALRLTTDQEMTSKTDHQKQLQ